MRVTVSSEALPQLNADALIVILRDGDVHPASTGQVDVALDGQLTHLLSAGELSVKPGRSHVLFSPRGLNVPVLLAIGGGDPAKLDPAAAVRIAGAALKRLADRRRNRIVLCVDGLAVDGLADKPGDAATLTAAIAAAMNAGYGQDTFKSEKNFHPCDELVLWSADPLEESVVRRGEALGRAQLLARELVNLPPNYLYPEAFATRAVEVCGNRKIELEIWDEARLIDERCGALLAVAAGSERPPRLLIMRYAGTAAASGAAPTILVGKGVTFDSGGYSIKPTDGMLSMKCDMAGAATVLAAMQAAADLELPEPLIGIVGLVENLISGSAFKLGDVLTARSGTTIEVHNTDAEGRLVLADALNVALDMQPGRIIDLATLTGACVVALGTDIAGVMGNDPELQSSVQAAAVRAGELVWPLPMLPLFDEQIQGQVADIKNVGDGRWGGAITAAKFLQRFVGDTPWLHIDIAGPAFADKPKPHQDGGGTGCMLRTLIEFIAPTGN
jgi:leucyl aminopeptidase